MSPGSERLRELVRCNAGLTMRDAVQQLEAEGWSPETASEALIDALSDEHVTIDNNYVLARKPA